MTGPGRRKGTTEGGGREQPAGEGSQPHSTTKTANKETPATPKAAHKGQREDNRRIAGRNTNRKTPTEEPQQERNQEKTNTEQRARKAQTKTRKTKGPGGGQDHEKASKKTPTNRQQVGADH